MVTIGVLELTVLCTDLYLLLLVQMLEWVGVMANLVSQFNGIKNHLRDILLNVSVKEIPESFKRGVKTYSECGCQYSWAWVLD